MADNDKEVVEGATSRGADWEVVTLTASAYAAAPGPGGGTPADPTAESNTAKDERGSSNALLMSDHFVFPPSEHENLPIETTFQEIPPEKDAQEASTSMEDDSFKNVAGNYDVGSERIQYYDDGKNLSVDEAEMKGDVAEYGSFHTEDDGHAAVVHDNDNDDGDNSHVKSDLPSESADSKSHDSGPPCQCWLKKHMSCLYHQAKETNALWSVVVAAALVGLVILWRKDRLHLNCLKWRPSSAARG